MKKLLDTNLIIRYLLNDDRKKAEAVDKILKSRGKIILTDVAISEVIWVLSSYYQVSRGMITEWMVSLLSLSNIHANKTILQRALSYYVRLSIDWIDAYLVAFAVEKKVDKLYSYDRDFDKIKEIKREEP